jgi:catechol 2,3-dioxygenase-like lactoylglutathione lyase family enzyme
MRIKQLDHLVLTVKNIQETVRFYVSVLGMEREIFGDGRVALKFGCQKINLHEAGKELDPKAHQPTPGSADLCLVTDIEIKVAMAHVTRHGVDIIAGPVPRQGANGAIVSFYIRDPDFNLIEIANYL